MRLLAQLSLLGATLVLFDLTFKERLNGDHGFLARSGLVVAIVIISNIVANVRNIIVWAFDGTFPNPEAELRAIKYQIAYIRNDSMEMISDLSSREKDWELIRPFFPLDPKDRSIFWTDIRSAGDDLFALVNTSRGKVESLTIVNSNYLVIVDSKHPD